MSGNNKENVQLHKFTTSENIAKVLVGEDTCFNSYCTTHDRRVQGKALNGKSTMVNTAQLILLND